MGRQDPEVIQTVTNRQTRDKGSITMEMAIIAPLIMLCLLIIFHIAVWSQASSIAHAASSAALTDARRLEGSEASGTAAARKILQDNSTMLKDSNVSVNVTGETVTVRITGRSTSFVPGKMSTVTSEVRGPKERTTAP